MSAESWLRALHNSTKLVLSGAQLKNAVATGILSASSASQLWDMVSSSEPDTSESLNTAFSEGIDSSHILLHDYYLFELIPFYYICCLFLPACIYATVNALFQYIHKGEGISPVMRALVVPVEIIYIFGMFQYCLWLESGKAFVLSIIILALTQKIFDTYVVSPIVTSLRNSIAHQGQVAQDQGEDIMASLEYQDTFDAKKHPFPRLVVLRVMLRLVFIFTSSQFLRCELVTIFFWLFFLDFIFALAELLKHLNSKKLIAFQQIYLMICAIALPFIGKILDLPKHNYYSLLGTALSFIIGIHAFAQFCEVTALGLGELRASSTQAAYKNKLAEAITLKIQSKQFVISFPQRLAAAWAPLILYISLVYAGIHYSFWPFVVSGFLGLWDCATVMFTLFKDNPLFQTALPVFLLFMTFQMNQTRSSSDFTSAYLQTPVISGMLSEGAFLTTASAFLLRGASFVLLIAISGTINTLKHQMETLRKEGEDQALPGPRVSLSKVVFNIVWNYFLVVVCVLFAKREPSYFFSVIYSVSALVYMLKPHLSILVLQGFQSAETVLSMALLMVWRLSVLTLDLVFPFQMAGLLFMGLILLSFLIKDKTHRLRFQKLAMAIFFIHGILSTSNLYIFQFSVLLHLIIPLLNLAITEREQADKKDKSPKKGMKSTSVQYILLWITLFCLCGFSFAPITTYIRDALNSFTNGLLVRSFYDSSSLQFEESIVVKLISLVEGYL